VHVGRPESSAVARKNMSADSMKAFCFGLRTSFLEFSSWFRHPAGVELVLKLSAGRRGT
jgi:hypothetical protein